MLRTAVVSAFSGTIMSTTGENPDKTINRLLHPIKLSPATHALHSIKLSTATHAVPLNKTINGTCTLFL